MDWQPSWYDPSSGEDSTTTIDRSFVDAIQGWLKTCDDEHECSQTSNESAQQPPIQQCPSWLIDTKNQCIVRGSQQRYIALSYTWPGVTGANTRRQLQLNGGTLKLDEGTLESFQERDSLSKILSQLPEVLQDAINLTPMIGERYLWVDRLCIPEDPGCTRSEVMRMHQTYSGAYVTLVAARHSGLYDRTIAQRRRPFPRANRFRHSHRFYNLDGDFDAKVRQHYRDISRSSWANRAWTYQEHILSKRLIFFEAYGIFWECERSVWDMDRLPPRESDQSSVSSSSNSTLQARSDLGKRLMTTSSPDFGLYIDLICPYNGRELTNEGDGLLACSGILNRLTSAFPDGFFYGLPRNTTFLDHALLWQPLRSCRRRKGLATGTKHPLPSWSWCGWQCYVDPRSLLSGLSAEDAGRRNVASSWETQSLVTWNILTQNGTRVPASGSINIENALPQLVCRTEQAFFRVAASLEVQKHVVLPRDEYRGGGHLDAFEHPVLTDSLCSISPVLVLQDSNGNFSGLLRLTGDTECKYGDVLETVAISKGSAKYDDLKMCLEEKVFRRSEYKEPMDFEAQFNENGLWIGESQVQERQYGRYTFCRVATIGNHPTNLGITGNGWGDREICTFYNVLCVKRANGIAYRVACGRIAEETWVQNRAGETELVLG